MAADDRTDIERLAKLFDLPSWDKVEEFNLDYLGDVYAAVRKEAIEGGKSEDEAEKAAQDAELKTSEEVYRD